MAPATKEDPTASLEAAAAAADDAGALAHLIDAWRALPAPELASLIERVSDRATQARAPVDGKTLTTKHHAFFEIASKRNPVDLPRLLAVVPTMRSAQAAEELDALLMWPADPRTTPFFLQMINKPPYRGSSTAKVWRRVFDLFVASGDPRLLEALPKLDLGDIFEQGAAARAVTQNKLASAIVTLEKQFPNGPPKLEGRAREIFDKLGTRKQTERGSLDVLLERIFANPDDDAARLVYADALEQAGDPRGALVALQFAKTSRALTAEESRREKAIVHENFARFFGDLAPIVVEDGTFFEKGFPSRVRVNLTSETQRKIALGHPLWATVKTIDLNHAEELPLDVLTHPAMRALTGVVNLRRGAFLDLARRATPLPWKHLGYWGPSLYADEYAGDRAQNEEDRALIHGLHRVLPSLERLSLSGYLVGPSHFRWLWDAPIVKQLTRFDVSSGVGTLPAWIEELRAHAPHLRVLGVPSHWDFARWVTEVEHGAGGPFSILRAHMYPASRNGGGAASLEELAVVLEKLPDDLLTEVRVTASRTTKVGIAAIEKAARKQKRLAMLMVG